MIRFQRLYDAGAVTRFHTKRVLHRQTLAEHSWGVAMILLEICQPSPALLKTALTHDLAESETGDVPATAKWVSKDLAWSLEAMEFDFNKNMNINFTLSAHEQECLKWADMLELIMYCQTEVSMGNIGMGHIVGTGIAYLDARKPPTLLASAFLEQLR